jgi:hypothetical protein
MRSYHRKGMYTNLIFLISLLAILAYDIYIVVGYDENSAKFLFLYDLPYYYRMRLVVLIIGNSLCTFFYEGAIIRLIEHLWQIREK